MQIKKISIIGTGLGPATITHDAHAAIQDAQVLLGAKRMLDMFSQPGKPAIEVFSPDAVLDAIDNSSADRFAILVSGDTGFYSAADRLCRALDKYELTVLPGISSLNYFFARLKLPWQDAALISCHGQNGHIVDTVRRNRLTFALTGGNTKELAEQLSLAGFGSLSVTTGENLGTPNEKIRSLSISDMLHANISPLCVILVKNPCPDSRILTGMPDERFIRGSVPMTKAEVRAIVMSRLAIRPCDVCWDVGCGTGSVTVEMALSAYKGHVYAMDRSTEAIKLTMDNCAAFHIGNTTVISGNAPSCLHGLPAPDAVFIGGTGGNMQHIVSHIAETAPMARIAITAIAPESLCSALAALKCCGIKPDITQISIARSKETAGLHMLTANNPIFLIAGGING